MRTPAFFALALCALQISFFLLAAPGVSLGERYQSASVWDGQLFADIAERGYVSPVPPIDGYHNSNVTHFPGFPLAARLVSSLTTLSAQIAVVVASQLFAWVFWFYAFRLLLLWSFAASEAALVLLAAAAFPLSFFLVVGLSESLFLACLLGAIVWDSLPGRRAAALAAIHGFGLGLTRITGAAAAIALLFSAKPRGWRRPVVALSTLLGPLLFFAFLAWRFGDWRLYMETQELGWGSRADFTVLFYAGQYAFGFPDWGNYLETGLVLRSYLGLGIVLAVLLEFFAREAPGRRACVLVALLIFVLTFAGQSHAHFRPIARHYLPSFLLIFFVLISHARNALQGTKLALRAAFALGLVTLAAGGIGLQFTYAAWFARHGMVF